MNSVVKQIKRSFAVFSALFITVVTSKIHEQKDCFSERLVHCAKPLALITDSGLTFASSKPDLDRMCPDLNQALRCIHHYTRNCMTWEEAAHFRKLFHGTGLMVRDLCKNETYQTEYLKHAPCMKKVQQENEICLKRYTTSMKDIELRTTEETTSEPDLITYQKRKREAADEGIKSVCCSFQTYMECSTHTVRRTCGEDAAEFSRDFLDKMSSSLIKLHCQEYGRRECGLMASSTHLQSTAASILAILSFVIYFLR